MTRLEQIKARKDEWLNGMDHCPINKSDLEALIELAEAAIEGWGCIDQDDLMYAVKKFEEAPTNG